MSISRSVFVKLRTQFLCHREYNFKSGTSIRSYGIEQSSIKKRICIVGAGPAGFYAAQYILKHLNDSAVDIIEKLPVPFGLVRFGVAPDHPEVKNVINTFSKTAENANFRFFGNLTLGKDIGLQELRSKYHAVLLTYGADRDRQLNIPTEDKSNVLSARKFVAWYNGLPGDENLKPDLSGEALTIVGQGNVAIDVARILLSPLDTLKTTDITEYALDELSRSKVKHVFLVGRRGPLQAAFTIKELREMLKLPNVETIWRPQDFKDIPERLADLQRPRKRLTELMLKSLNEQKSSNGSGKKTFSPVFFRAPKSIGNNEMDFAVTKLENNLAVITNETETLPADLVLRSIGYKSSCADDDICFDERNGHVHNKSGRVIRNLEDGTMDKGLYTAGWLATGPTGVILTTMNNAFGVAKAICDDILNNEIDANRLKPGIDVDVGKRVVSWNDWKKIDEEEIRRGEINGKPREKIVSIDEMLKVAGV